jgi:DNA replication protein DnaC
MLKETYKYNVYIRENEFIEDETTVDKIRKVANWLCAEKKKFGLLLFGGVGNGKTTLAQAICNMLETITKGNKNLKEIKFEKISALHLANKAIDNKERFEELKMCENLLLDDIGIEPLTVKNYGNEISAIVELIYSRYDRRLFTIATSNLNDKQLSERYEVRVYDRINEMFNKIAFKNKSFRK